MCVHRVSTWTVLALLSAGSVACDGSGDTPATANGGESGEGAAPEPPDAAGGGDQSGGSAGVPSVVNPPADARSVTANPDDAAADLFDQTQFRTYELFIDEADLAQIDEQPAAEVYVPGRFKLGTEELAVGVRYKGSVGAFGAPCTDSAFLQTDGSKAGKCSLKVSFSWTDPEQKFHGLKKLNFHSLNADPSLMRDRLGYSLFRDFGLPAPRAVHARLLINGQLEGVFGLIEEVDGRFTRSRFGDGGEGNLYKEIWPIHTEASAYLAALETNEDETPSVDNMLEFRSAIGTGIAGVESWLDRDASIRFIAADRVMGNDDGLFHWWCGEGGQGNNPGGNGNHNYYWYEHQGVNLFSLIAWDMDHSFAGSAFVKVDPEWREPGSCACVFALQRAPSCDPMINLWASEWTTDYEAAIDEFLSGPFRAALVEEKINAWSAQITAAVQEADGINASVSFSAWQAALVQLLEVTEQCRVHRGLEY